MSQEQACLGGLAWPSAFPPEQVWVPGPLKPSTNTENDALAMSQVTKIRGEFSQNRGALLVLDHAVFFLTL